MKFRSRTDNEINLINNSGTKIREEYIATTNENGEPILECIGRTNQYETIQANADSVNISKIMEKCSVMGLTALNQREGIYTDITDIPNNLNDLNNMAKVGKATAERIEAAKAKAEQLEAAATNIEQKEGVETNE